MNDICMLNHSRENISKSRIKILFYLDEVGFTVSSRTRRGRSVIGNSAYNRLGAIRTRNISLIAAMNRYGMVTYKLNQRPVNGEDFNEFLRFLKSECTNQGIESPVFRMDNARINHYRGFQIVIDELELEILYLAPYSPFLNPIENVFSKWKNSVLRGQATNEEELMVLIEEGFRTGVGNYFP